MRQATTPPAPTSAQLQLQAREARDSRGRPTVAVTATLGPHAVEGDVPAGASKGEDEARTVPVAQAIAHIAQDVLPLLRAMDLPMDDVANIVALDRALAAAAGPNLVDWGANTTLPVSRALWRLGAACRGEPLWAFLRRGLRPTTLPAARPTRFFMNVFNGGLHALRPADGEVLGRDRIAIQEIMVVPVAAASYAAALAVGEAVDAALKAILIRTYGADAVTRADEAGFSVRGLGDDDRAIDHVVAAIASAGFAPGREVKIALDVAASSLFDRATGSYRLGAKPRTSDEMIAWHEAFVDRYRGVVLSIEDGLDENDWSGWADHAASMAQREVITVGDDLFVTQLPRLRRGIAAKSASAVLIKVNQNGTVAGTLAVIDTAHAAGMDCVVSHRSGETLDDSISDLAVAARALGLKSGDPQPEKDFVDPTTWVRRRKYLRMAAIEREASGR